MSPQFFQRQALLFYVESEPRGTSPVPNVESLVFTPWKYEICPDRDLNPEPSDWHTCVLTMRPPRLSNDDNYHVIDNYWWMEYTDLFDIIAHSHDKMWEEMQYYNYKYIYA